MRAARIAAAVVLAAVLAPPRAWGLSEVIAPPLRLELGVTFDRPEHLARVEVLAHDYDYTVRIPVAFDDDADTVDAGLDLADAAAGHGWQVMLLLRYRIPQGTLVDPPAAFAAWAADVASRAPADAAFDVTNRVNAAVPDPWSDAGQPGAFEALVGGVLAVKATRPGAEVGFSWLASGVEAYETVQFTRLGLVGGGAFAAAVDFVGVQLHSGTLTPGSPYERAEDAETAANRGILAVRDAMPLAGLHFDVPIDVTEFGFPVAEDAEHAPAFVNAPDLGWATRAESAQARFLRETLTGAERVAEALNVRRALWWDLADPPDCGDLRLCSGLLRPDGSERQAFDRLRFEQTGRAEQGTAG